MNTPASHRRIGLGSAIVCALICLSGLSHAQKATQESTLAQMEKALSASGLPADEAGRVALAIRESRSDLESGYLYLSIYKLQTAWVEIMTRGYVKSKA